MVTGTSLPRKRIFGESAIAGRTDLMYREAMAKFAVCTVLLQMP